MTDRPTMTDQEMIKDYPRLKLEYTRLHEDYRRLTISLKNINMNEFTGNYYECSKCKHITDYSDSHCSECGSQNETELNAKEVMQKANILLIIRDFEKNKIGKSLIEMLKKHDDL